DVPHTPPCGSPPGGLLVLRVATATAGGDQQRHAGDPHCPPAQRTVGNAVLLSRCVQLPRPPQGRGPRTVRGASRTHGSVEAVGHQLSRGAKEVTAGARRPTLPLGRTPRRRTSRGGPRAPPPS